MPWTKADVDRHKKNLTDKQKERWVEVANDARKRCLAKGGSEKECDASAIRQANSVVGNQANMLYVNEEHKNYEVSRKKYNGEEYLVVPVTMMVEGVHSGSRGALLHTIEELGKFPEAWNGIPVVLDHPQRDGNAVSANDPEILELCGVGNVYSTHINGSRLKAEAWLHPERLAKIAPNLIEQLEKGEMIEVSLGVFTDEELLEGDWNGELYEAIAKNHRPDHLALLPDGEGACSIEDGCGIRANAKDKSVRILIQEKLQSINTGDILKVEEVLDDCVIFAKETKESKKLFRQPYLFESGKIELEGEPEEVHRKVEYVELNKKKEVIMSEKKKECPECLKKVDALIANEQSRFTEEDREVLMTFEEDFLDKLEPVVVEKEVEKKVEVNALSDEDKAALAAYKKQQKERRDAIKKEIQDNTSEERWPMEVLDKFDDETLVRLHESVKKEEEEADYSVMGGYRAAKGVDPLLPAGYGETKKE